MIDLALVTNSPTAACSMFYDQILKKICRENGFVYNFLGTNQLKQKKNEHNVICIMFYDIKYVKEIREDNPRAKICVVDPRNSSVLADQFDFMIVDSQEMLMFWQGKGFSGKILMLSEYPDISNIEKLPRDKGEIAIGYHGNFIHLASGIEIIEGIDIFQKSERIVRTKKKVIFRAMMAHQFSDDFQNLMTRFPDVSYEFIPWSIENYARLQSTIIGLVPNNIPSLPNDAYTQMFENYTGTKFNLSQDDQFARWKMPSNGGRIITFSQIPGERTIISDCYPSACAILGKNEWGYIAGKNSQSWSKMMLNAYDNPKCARSRVDILLFNEKREFIEDLREIVS